jgi:hypothetical protein
MADAELSALLDPDSGGLVLGQRASATPSNPGGHGWMTSFERTYGLGSSFSPAWR